MSHVLRKINVVKLVVDVWMDVWAVWLLGWMCGGEGYSITALQGDPSSSSVMQPSAMHAHALCCFLECLYGRLEATEMGLVV